MRTHVRVDEPAYSNANSAESNTNITNGEENDETSEAAETVHYKPLLDQGWQVRQHVRIHHSERTQPKTDWCEEVALSSRYQFWRESFANMLSKFQSMRNGHLECINTARHCIELLSSNTSKVYCAPNRAGPKTRKFGNIKVDKMLVKHYPRTSTIWMCSIYSTRPQETLNSPIWRQVSQT